MNFKLHDQEHLRDIYRQSKLFLLKPMIISLVFVFLPWYLLAAYNLASQLSVLIIILFIGGGGYFLKNFIIWYETKYVITNKRLLLYAHSGLFKRSVIDTPMERILNVSYKTTGLMSSIFGFGDVEVQVVGLMEPVILKHIQDPSEIKDYLWELHKRVVPDKVNYDSEQVPRYQERLGYTKKNQRML